MSEASFNADAGGDDVPGGVEGWAGLDAGEWVRAVEAEQGAWEAGRVRRARLWDPQDPSGGELFAEDAYVTAAAWIGDPDELARVFRTVAWVDCYAASC